MRKIKVYILTILDPISKEAIDTQPYGNITILSESTGIPYNKLRRSLSDNSVHFEKDIQLTGENQIGIKVDVLIQEKELIRGERKSATE